MVRKADKKTMSLIKEHLVFIKKRFNPEKIILFGSRARGDNLEESDVDIIIVSEYFKNIPFRERIIEGYGYWDKKQGLDIICYTPEEFNTLKGQISIISEAVKEGIEIK